MTFTVTVTLRNAAGRQVEQQVAARSNIKAAQRAQRRLRRGTRDRSWVAVGWRQ